MALTVVRLGEIYVSLLMHPHDAWRAQNQTIYCTLRDEIAAALGIDAESVQTTFEAKAAAMASLREWAR